MVGLCEGHAECAQLSRQRHMRVEGGAEDEEPGEGLNLSGSER